MSSLHLSVSTEDAATTDSRGGRGEKRKKLVLCTTRSGRNEFVPSPVDGEMGSEDRRGTKRKREEGEVVEALRRGGWKLVPHTSP